MRDKMFHVSDGLYFIRKENGSVTIVQTTDGKEPVENNIKFRRNIDDGSWCSVVLSMTDFSERPGDWSAWMRHHKGKEDLLVGKRGGY
jgi:hypothetical protein